MASMKEKALALAAKGFAVFPLQENSKKPLPGSAGFKDATTDQFQIEEWWEAHPNANIGLYPDACRPRLLIVDVDSQKGGDDTVLELERRGLLPSVLMVKTPRGWHRYYVMPDDKALQVQSSVEKLGKGIDVRAHGGYVVAPGSVIDGKEYKWVGTFNRVGAPNSLIEACGAAEERHRDADKWLVEPDLPANVAHAIPWLQTTEPAIEGGGGDNHTFQTAAMLRDRGISEETALELLLEHWNPRCIPRPWPEDMLANKVHNAYQHAKRPAGTEAWSRKAAALATAKLANSQEIPEKVKLPTTGYSRLRPVTLDELALRPRPRWLVKGILPELGLGGIIGPVSAYKSFLALDAGLHIAHGLQWMGLKTQQRSVVYVAGEGPAGIQARVKAWLIQHEITDNPVNFHLVEVMPSFMDADAIRALAAYLKPLNPGMVIIDTVARAMAGLDENSVQGMSTFIQVADQLGNELTTFVLLVHHTGKDVKLGSRGSSALPAALDAELIVSARPEDREAYLKLKKAKEAEAWTKSHTFKGLRVDLGVDEDGDSLSSLAFIHQGVTKPGVKDPEDVLHTGRWDAFITILEGKGPNESLSTKDLAHMIARATTAEDDWPDEGPAQARLVEGVSRWLRRTAKTSEGQRWMLTPGSEGISTLWRAPKERRTKE